MPTKLSQATKTVGALLRESPSQVFSQSALAKLFYSERRQGTFARNTTLEEFISFFVKQEYLHKVTLRSKKYRQSITRYCVTNPSPYELAQSLRPTGYLSHGTAARLHGLLGTESKTLYVNIEQSIKPRHADPITQESLDRAFSRKQRASTLSYANPHLAVTILSGKHTAHHGVEIVNGPSSEKVRTTNLERTLIDIAVRPAYADGINNVLACYRLARDRASIANLIKTLKVLDHAYPYSQAVGFLMQRAGFASEKLEPLKSRMSDLNFYLVHAMKKPRYDHAWRLFYPTHLTI